MKINCLSCGHKIDLDEAYDHFEGLVKCFVCGALLEIRTEVGSLKWLDFRRTETRRSHQRVDENSPAASTKE